jgi:hypothetical protein
VAGNNALKLQVFWYLAPLNSFCQMENSAATASSPSRNSPISITASNALVVIPGLTVLPSHTTWKITGRDGIGTTSCIRWNRACATNRATFTSPGIGLAST